jgi:hypothetical protein
MRLTGLFAVDAFVAMGGNPDKSGRVEAEKLRKTIRAFELTINIDKLIRAPALLSCHIRMFSVSTVNAVGVAQARGAR